MNIERLNELADIIVMLPHARPEPIYGEQPPAAFNMGMWHCGAVACIGGWAEALYLPDYHGAEPTWEAGKALGLSEDEADQLFYPEEQSGWRAPHTYDDITPMMAAAVIRHLADTGIIDWGIAIRQLDRQLEPA